MEPDSLIGRVMHPFATLFGGAPDPRLGPDANRQAMRNAILTGGLNTMAVASQPGANAVGSIAQGALAGQQAGAQGRQAAVQQQGRDQIAQLAEAGIDIPTARQMLVTALSTGDMESAKLLTAALTSMQASQATPRALQRQRTVHPETGQDVIAAFDPTTGRYDFTNAVPAPPDAGVYERTFVLDEGNGERGLYGIVEQTGEQVRLGSAPTPGGGTGGVQGALMRGLANAAGQANEALEPLDAELSGFFINASRRAGDNILGDINRAIANAASDGQAGLALTAGLNFINPSVRFLSGAQMNENEAARYIVALLPVTWDPPEVRQFKRQMRDSLVEAMKTSGTGDQWLEQQDPSAHERVMELQYTTPPGQGGLFPPRGGGS